MGKLTSEQVEAKYKSLYGEDGEFKISEDGRVFVPTWFLMLVIHRSGVKSRKIRILKKVVKKEINKLLKDSILIKE